MSADEFTRPTTDFWQELVPPGRQTELTPPYRYAYPARLPDGRLLELPIRRLPDTPTRAVASLIANHASSEVVASLATFMADLARPIGPDVIVGLPTLGFTFAPAVAERLGHRNYVPLGYSRKFWYDDALAEPTRSLTTLGGGKKLYIDPNLVPRIRGRRTVLVDDAVSTGQTMVAAIRLLTRLEADIAGIVVAMRQGTAWRNALGAIRADWPDRVLGVFDSPRLHRVPGGWAPEETTLATACAAQRTI